MKTDTQLTTEARVAALPYSLDAVARVAVNAAIFRLEKRGHAQFAALERVSRHITEKHVAELLRANYARIVNAPLLQVSRAARTFAYRLILTAATK